MQVLQTPPIDKQRRSMSYNDLKKKRLMRSTKSHKKLNNNQNDQSTVKKKGMSQVKSIISTLPQDQKVIENCINQLKDVLGSLRSRNSKTRIISVRESQTQRPTIKQSFDLENYINKPIWNNVEQTGDTKNLIKQILNKNKSQRRLIKFNEVRDKFKKVKQRSLSNEKKGSIKIIPSPIKDKTSVKINNAQNDIYSKFTQPIIKKSQSKNLQQQLAQCTNQIQKKWWIQEISGKQNEQINIKSLQFNNISSILQKTNQKFNQSQLKIIEGDTAEIQGSFLKLLNQDLQRHKHMRSKEIRRKNELQRMKKIFPSDFFDY